MSQLNVYNWTPFKAYVQVNGLTNTTWSPLFPSSSEYQYFPYHDQILRDLTPHGRTENVWGTMNNLIVRLDTVSGSMYYRDIADPPGASGDVDMLLWIFTNRVVLSQSGRFITEIRPESA